MDEASRQAHASAAAEQAAEGLVMLLRYAGGGVLEEGMVELLLDSAKLALEVMKAEEGLDEDANQVHGAISRYLDGWAG